MWPTASLLAWLTSTGALAGDVEAGGAIQSNLHLGVLACDGLVADCPWLEFQDLVVLSGHLRGEPNESVSYALDGRLRLHQSMFAETVADTAFNNELQPFSVDVNEAWVEAGDLLAQGIHLRIGQQRFAWGVAEGVNPVDVVNPYDLANPTRFDQRLGIPAVSVLLTRKQGSLELVYLPLFRPARMPQELDILEDAADLFDFSDVGGGDIVLGEAQDRTQFPDRRLGFQSFALRGALATSAVDVAVIAYSGRDSLPQAGGEALIVGFGSSNSVDVGIPVLYPRVQLAGAELRTELPGAIGFFAEGAAILPERTVVTANRAQLQSLERLGTIDEVPDPLPETVIQDGLVYGRWVVGVQRFLGPSVLATAQYIHGLPTERTREEANHYGSLGLQITFTDTLQLQTRSIAGPAGFLVGADLVALHRDQVELTLGGTVMNGPEGSALRQFAGMSNVTLSTKVQF